LKSMGGNMPKANVIWFAINGYVIMTTGYCASGTTT